MITTLVSLILLDFSLVIGEKVNVIFIVVSIYSMIICLLFAKTFYWKNKLFILIHILLFIYIYD